MSSDMNGFPAKGSFSNIAVDTDNSTLNRIVPQVLIKADGQDVDIDIVLAPKGAGAVSINQSDGGLLGGNKRGKYAVDLQGVRNLATQVPTGQSSFAAGYRNTVAGDGAIAMGFANSASGNNSVALCSGSSTAGAASFAAVAGTASGNNSAAVGNACTSSGIYSFSCGNSSNTFTCTGRFAHASASLAVSGDSQGSRFSIRKSTTDATPAIMTTDAATQTAANGVTLQNNNSFSFMGQITVRQTASTVSSCWKFEGLIIRGTTAATTVLITSTVTAISNATAIPAPDFTADTTLGALVLTVTGVAATSFRWHAVIDTCEVIYA